MNLKQRADNYAAPYEETGFAVDIATAYSLGFRVAIALAAEKAFEKIRCDDRTDRWQVANEVAAHIRALAESETPPGACL